MTAARMRVTNSSRETTCLPRRCPQRFVCTWSSMWQAATPERAYCVTVRPTIAGPPNLSPQGTKVSRSRRCGVS